MFRNRVNKKIFLTITALLLVLLMLVITDFIPEIRSALAVPSMGAIKTDLNWLTLGCPGAYEDPLGLDLVVDADGDGEADPGDVLRYTVCIINYGNSSAGNVYFEDTIDINTTLVPGSVNTSPIARNDLYETTTNVGISKDASQGVLANDDDPDGLGSLPGVSVYSADTTSLNGGAVSVVADGSFTYDPPLDFTGVDYFEYVAVDEEGVADLGMVTILVNPSTASLGTNNRPAFALAWSRIVDLASSYFPVLVHASGETINLSLGDFDPGQVVLITFDVTIDSPFPSGVLEVCNQSYFSGDNFIDLVTDDPSTAAFYDPTCTPVDLDTAPDLTITKDDGGVSVPAGGTISYTLTFTNNGDADATGVVVNETVPANTTFNPIASTTGWVCLPDNNANSSCSFDLGTMPGGGSGGLFVFAVDVDRPLAPGITEIINAVMIEDDGAGGADSNPADNNDLDITPIDFPDLQITKDDGGLSVPAGGTISYTLTFTNNGDADATGVVVHETVPANTTFNPIASTTGWVCVPDNNANSSCSFDLGTVPGGGAGGLFVFAVDVDSPLASDVTEIINAVMIEDDGAGGPDVNPGDNTDLEITPITLSLQISNPIVTVDEGQTAFNDGTVGGGDGFDLSASVGTATNNGDGTWGWSFPTSDGPSESQIVTITAEDGSGNIATGSFDLIVNNLPPVIDSITIPLDPVNINDQPISVSAAFSDPADSADQPYTCTVDYGDGTGLQAGTIALMACQGPDHTYASSGVYPVTVTVTDKDGGTGSAEAANYIVIFDPDGGFVTGGGWVWSSPGAYKPDPSLEGKATLGFVSKYKKGSVVPAGNTEFQFKVADLNFQSTNYDWLVVTGNGEARFKGSGTINGIGEYNFMIWAGDGDPDTFRIRIWTEDEFANETTVYDNGFEQALSGGSIVVHSK